jgi:ribonuclease BN (tRNA processing enzyme)
VAGLLVLAGGAASPVAAQACAPTGVSLQVLGSNGPRIDPSRASTSYLLWVDGKARLLVDAGGGSFLRFGQSSAQLNDLWLAAFSHLHPDHTSDLPALLWLSEAARDRPLRIVGPPGDDVVPDFATFLTRLFDERQGAFPLLGPTLGGTNPNGRGVRLEPTVVDFSRPGPATIVADKDFRVSALSIPHGMPTVAYRVETAGVSVVFSSDQNGTNEQFPEFARDANLLIMHLAIGAGVTFPPIHASPEVVGRVAAAARPKHLVLSHLGRFDLAAAEADVRKAYAGPLTVAEDLKCVAVR